MDSESDDELFVKKTRQKSVKKSTSVSQKGKRTQVTVKETSTVSQKVRVTSTVSQKAKESSTVSQKVKGTQSSPKKSTTTGHNSQENTKKKIVNHGESEVFQEVDSKKIESWSDSEGKEEEDDGTIESVYCPTCQAPLHYLKISPAVHAASCTVDWSTLTECPEGPSCVCDTIFHYRDFAHKLLAEFRSTKQFVSPRVKRRTVSKTRSKRALSSSKKVLPHSKDDDFNENAVTRVKRKLDYNDPGPSGKKRRSLPSESSSQVENKAPKSEMDFNEPGPSSKKRRSLPSGSSSQVENKAPKSETGYNDPGPSGKKQRSLPSESSSQVKNKSSKFETITLDENDSNTNRKTQRNESQLYTEPVSTPSQSEVPSYLLTNFDSEVINTEIKSEITESYEVVEDSLECGLFENSQDLPSSLTPHQNSGSGKGKPLSSNCQSLYNSLVLSSAQEYQNLPYSASVTSSMNYPHEPSISIDISEHPIKLEVCSNDYQENASIKNREMEDLDMDMAQFDDEFEKCFDKYNETESNGNDKAPNYLNMSDFDEEFEKGFDKYNGTESIRDDKVPNNLNLYSDDSSNVSCDELDVKKKRSSKNQEDSKNLWKQILKPKALPLTTNNSSSSTPKVRYDRFSKTRVVIGDNQSKDMNAPLNKTCPFYKKIPDTTFVVDAFSYGIIPGVTSYFLSHFHADHYIGLRKGFNKPIYCSRITANLVNMKIGVKEEFFRILNLREPRIINGVEVTAFDANHCPGAFMFLFRLTDNRQYLHVGDFRACREMESEPILRKAQITALFLDTTYCNPQYTFPLQRDVIRMVVDVVKKKVSECPRLLVACGSYTIGKEKVFLGILDEFTHWKLWAQQPKQRVLRVLENDQITSKLVSSPNQANVHVLSMKELNFQALDNHLSKVGGSFTHVLAFKPTGWEMGKGKKVDVLNHTSNRNITIYGVPYSEHSSYSELCRFTQFIAPEKVIPTVNVGNPVMRKKMMTMIDDWLKKPQNKSEQLSLKSFF